jgi:hypothetical protein
MSGKIYNVMQRLRPASRDSLFQYGRSASLIVFPSALRRAARPLSMLFASCADYAAPYTVFDVGGNNYRVVAMVRYRDGKIFVRWVMSHREYGNWRNLYRKGKV